MNKARPLLLERPGFFSAVRLGGGEDRRGAGERVVARQGRGALCIAGRNAPQGCGRPAGHCKGVQRTLKSTQDTPRAGKGHPQSGQGAPQSAWGTPERMGHPRAHGASQAAWGHPRAHRASQGAQGIPGRTGGNAGRMGATAECTGHRRPHGGTAERTGAPQSARNTTDRARTLQCAQGIPGARRRTLGRRAAREGCQQPKKGPFGRRPKGAKEPFFAPRKKFQIFWQKQLTNPYVDGNIYLAPALVAQLDRVSDYESEGREFESLPAHQEGHPKGCPSFLFFPPASLRAGAGEGSRLQRGRRFATMVLLSISRRCRAFHTAAGGGGRIVLWT